MLCLVVTPQLCRAKAEVEQLRGMFANCAHYEYMVEEDALVVGPEGVLARLVTNALSERLIKETAAHFMKVRSDASARPSVVGKGAMMNRLRKDGTMGATKEVPSEIIKKMRSRNTFTDFLGWMDASHTGDRFPECRRTGWSVKAPEIHEAAYPFVQEVSRVYREELPDQYARQREFMREVETDWKFRNSVFSTVTVNRNLRTAYHYDGGDFRGGMGNLVVLRGNGSGELVMPRFRVAFRVRPTDVLLMNVHELHGNLKVGGERLTAVLYARERINACK